MELAYSDRTDKIHTLSSTGNERREKDVYIVKLIYIANNFFSWICVGNARWPSITKDSPRAGARTGRVSWISWKNIGGAV